MPCLAVPRLAVPFVAGPLLAALMVSAQPALAASGGAIGLLMTGDYQCERPGDAGGPHAHPDPQSSFRVIPQSRYVAGGAAPGTYLRRGETVTMTTGPLAGTRLLMRNGKFLRRIDGDGGPAALRCVLARHSDVR